MNRRNLLRAFGFGVTSLLAGCQESKRSSSKTAKSNNKSMDISPTVLKTDNGWKLKAIVANEDDWDASFHEIRLFAYDINGTKVCEEPVGDLTSSGEFQRTVQTTCSAFPAIVTATTQESPCQNALIPVLWWTGTKAQQKKTVAPDEWPWESTFQKCGEELPPQRILNKFENSSAGTK